MLNYRVGTVNEKHWGFKPKWSCKADALSENQASNPNGYLNVRTMYEARKTAQEAREMKRYNIQLLGLGENRWLQSGQMRLATGETLLYSGHTVVWAPHTEGVGLLLTPEAQHSLIGWEPVSSRIIWAKFNTNEKRIKLNTIQCCAPTNDADEEKKDTFYQQLQTIVDKAGKKM